VAVSSIVPVLLFLYAYILDTRYFLKCYSRSS